MTEVTPEFEGRPGRPYDVRNRTHYRANDDGTVSYVVVRADAGTGPNGRLFHFTGEDEKAAYALYVKWTGEQYDRVSRQSDRRRKWGPTGTGKLA